MEKQSHQQLPTQRFVSLYGYFAFAYPTAWTQETDEHGHYIFYNPNGGAGAIRVMVMEEPDRGQDDGAKWLEQVLQDHQEFEPVLYVKGQNRFVHFVKEHEVNGGNYTVYYWITTHTDKMMLFTLTVQTQMKDMPTAVFEREQMELLIASVEMLSGESEHHSHAPHPPNSNQS